MNININQFKKISEEEYLNYTPYQRLESTLTYITSRIISDMKKKYEDITSDEAIYYYISQCLLRLCVSKNWLNVSKENNLSTDYLYICLKRCYVFYTTK